MNPSFHFIYIFAILSTLSSWVDSKDFCIAFRENNDRIGYTYRRFYGGLTDEMPTLDIVIDGYYWRLQFSGKSNEERSLNFIDPNRKGIGSPVFSRKYFMATCIRTKEWDNGRAALFSKSDWNKVFVADIPSDDYKGVKDLTAYQIVDTLQMTSYYDQNFAFDTECPVKSPQEKCHKLVVINKYDINGNPVDTLEPYRFYVYANETHLRLSPEIDRHKYIIEYKAITQLTTDYEVVGIVPQYAQLANNTYGFIFLFLDDMKIRWCWSSGKSLDSDKCGENAEVLIDCFGTELPKGSPILIIIVCVVIFIVIVIASLLFLMAANKRAKKDAEFHPLIPSKTSTTVSKASKTPSAEKRRPKSPASKPLSPTKPSAGVKSPIAPKKVVIPSAKPLTKPLKK